MVAPYVRLTNVFVLPGFVPGGNAKKRLAAEMGIATSLDTLLRLIRPRERN